MTSVDLNCDMGESLGIYNIGNDAELMKYVSSVNIACGFHAGDPSVMRRTVELAAAKNIAIGAHPGYHDVQGFGRREIKMSGPEIYDMVLYQIGALSGFAKASGSRLHHVKPHGALYNTAAKDATVAAAIARAVFDFDKSLLFVGLAGSIMIEEAKKIGLRALHECFADRTYQDDGSLTPRSASHAMIDDPNRAADQVLQMVTQKKITSASGKEIPVQADTVCIHGDGPHAAEIARAVVNTLKKHNIAITRP